ncbi:MAG: hypothetical protein R3F17_12765 [Planctomycetota bacterium]
MRFAAAGEFFGWIYAPQSDLVIPAGLRIRGGVCARRLSLAANARVTIDPGSPGASPSN